MNMFKTTEAKTPEQYIDSLDEPRRTQIQTLHDLIINTVPKQKPFLISGMLGYGKYHYKYASGREGEWCLIGLASQKNYISVYVCAVTKTGDYMAEAHKADFPKASIGRSCIRFKKIEDIDLEKLKQVLKVAETLPAMGAI